MRSVAIRVSEAVRLMKLFAKRGDQKTSPAAPSAGACGRTGMPSDTKCPLENRRLLVVDYATHSVGFIPLRRSVRAEAQTWQSSAGCMSTEHVHEQKQKSCCDNAAADDSRAQSSFKMHDHVFLHLFQVFQGLLGGPPEGLTSDALATVLRGVLPLLNSVPAWAQELDKWASKNAE
eukprot:5666074-Amphidinium_carterae.2